MADANGNNNDTNGEQTKTATATTAPADNEEEEVLEVPAKPPTGTGDLNIGAAAKTFNPWGKVGHLTEPQKAALQKFLETVSIEHLEQRKNPHDTVEQFALRWLRARDFKVKDAVLMFNNHVRYVYLLVD